MHRLRFFYRLLPLVALGTSLLSAQKQPVEITVQAEGHPIAVSIVIKDENNTVISKEQKVPQNGEPLIVSLAPGTYWAFACDDTGYSPMSQKFVVGPGNAALTMNLAPADPGKVHGRVKKGAAFVPGARVTAEYDYHGCKSVFPSPDVSGGIVSDETGSYVIGLPQKKDEPLKYNVNAHLGPSQYGPRSFSFRKSADIAKVDLVEPATKDVATTAGASQTPSVGGVAAYQTTVGQAITLETAFAIRVLSTRRVQVSLEIPLVFRASAKVTPDVVNSQLALDYRALFLTPSTRMTFLSHGWFYPWISMGTGLAHFVPSKLNQLSQPSTLASSTSKLALQSGIGVDFWPTRHLGFRTDLRYFYSGTPNLGESGFNFRNMLSGTSGFLIR